MGLEVFLTPRSIAVVGASDRPGSWGSFIMESLKTWGFPGEIYPVNRRTRRLYGLDAHPHVRSLPEGVDLAVLTIPEGQIEEVVQACGEKGVRGLILITAGFGESVEGGRGREEALARLAKRFGMRILGPNVSGAFNLHARFNASGSPAEHLTPTPLAAVCQGGYAFYDLLAQAHERGMGVGKFVHTGNECDLEVTDFVEYFGEDPQVKGILLYLETLRQGRRFLEVARRVTREKPVVVYKAARTAGGQRAARSHTGALSGKKTVYEGALRQAGIILAPSMELLLPLGHALIERPSMCGNRVAIVTMGGSWGVALTDHLEEVGLRVPELSPPLQRRLRDLGMPLRASTRNPVDVGAAGPLVLSVDALMEIGRAILESREVDALVLYGLGRPGRWNERMSPGRRLFLELEKEVMRVYDGLQKEMEKPVIVGCCLSPWESQAVMDLNAEGIRILHRLDDIAWVLSLLKEFWEKRRQIRRDI